MIPPLWMGVLPDRLVMDNLFSFINQKGKPWGYLCGLSGHDANIACYGLTITPNGTR